MIGLVLASVIETKEQIQPTSDHNRVERQHALWKEKLLNSLSWKLLFLRCSIFYLFGLKNKKRAGAFYELAVIL